MTARFLCRVEEIAEGKGRGFRFGGGTEQRAIFLIRKHGALAAYRNSCPHTGSPLDWVPDRFFEARGEHLLCGAHGARFRPADGFCVSGPCAGQSLVAVAIRVEEGRILLAEEF